LAEPKAASQILKKNGHQPDWCQTQLLNATAKKTAKKLGPCQPI
jgi:hypothetical protein